MAQTRKITASVPKVGSKDRDVVFPTSLDEIRHGIGPWKNVREMVADAIRARTVKIQAEIRREITGQAPVESADDLEFSDE